MTETQEENLRMAYAIMFGFPAKKVRLSVWRTPGASDHALLNECGTAGCVAGILAAHPHFQSYGLVYNASLGRLQYRGQWDPFDGARELFGTDYIFDAGFSGVRGKRQALRRIRYALGDKITPERGAELARMETELTA